MGSYVAFKDFILALNPELRVDISAQTSKDCGNLYPVFTGLVKDLPSSVMKSISELSVFDVYNTVYALGENDANRGHYGFGYIAVNVELNICIGPVSECMAERLEKEWRERRDKNDN